MLALREAEHANLELNEAKRRFWAAFSRSRSLESTATGTMLSARRSRFFASRSRTAWPLLRREERSAHDWHSSCSPQTHQGCLVPVAGCFRQVPRFGEHGHRHNAQCSKKPLLRLREPAIATAAETRRAKPHITVILCAALKHIKDGCFRQEPRFGELRHRRNAQCAKKPLLLLREPDSVAAAETRRAKPHITGILRAALKNIKDANILALREAEHTNLKLPEAKRLSRAAFGRSRALESTATGTMLSARRSRFFASGSRPSRPLLRREERSRT
ncbi:unnamed protein product [Coccothraustes coccothraustes]